MEQKIHVCVLGLGYVGLPTSVVLFEHGLKVIGVDTDKEKLEKIRAGSDLMDEPFFGLQSALNSGKNRLELRRKPTIASVYLICVPTPLKKKGKSVRSLPEPDLKFVKQALLSIGSVAPEGALIILESTSPVGTTELMARWFMEIGLDPSRYHFAYCPERVIPGDVRRELINNDRLVGGLDLASTLAAKQFYNIFVKGTVWTCSARVAELSKLAENTFRDINIGFANELSLVCEDLNLDCNEVIRLTNKHPRVNILQPGIGVGGHCIAVDPWFIASMFPNKTPLIQSARQVNDAKTDHVIGQVIGEIKKVEECLQRPVVVSLFGLAYKANVSDVRGSPAVKIAKKLQQLGVRVLCVDPLVENAFGLELFDFETAACSSDLGIFLVKHEIFEEYKTQLQGFVKTLDFCNFEQHL